MHYKKIKDIEGLNHFVLILQNKNIILKIDIDHATAADGDDDKKDGGNDDDDDVTMMMMMMVMMMKLILFFSRLTR